MYDAGVLIIVDKLEVVEPKHGTIAAYKVVAVLAGRCSDKYVLGYTLSRLVFKFDFKGYVIIDILTVLCRAVSDNVAAVLIEKLTV